MIKKREKIRNNFRLSELGVYIYGRRVVIVDGSASIKDYTADNVIFDTGKKKAMLVISGKNLTVRLAGENVSEVRGHICSVKYAGDNGDV